MLALAAGTVLASTLGVAAPAQARPGDAPAAGAEGAAAASAIAVPSVSVTSSSPPSNIKAMQYLLSAWGVPTVADGSFGPATKASVITFQKRKALVADGVAGPKTMAALTATPGFENSPNASTSRAVQQLLVKLGYRVSVDGSFGPATLAAVKSFQTKVKIPVTGRVDALTWGYLFSPPVVAGSWQACTRSITQGIAASQTGYARNNIRVASCMIPTVNAMVDAAARDGVTLRANSGWRSREEQIALRRQNCGTTEYAIYRMPAASCSPNTAIPGTSIHEFGLAIDFANCGWNSPVRNWLLAHGAAYGYKSTVPSESWHFDTVAQFTG